MERLYENALMNTKLIPNCFMTWYEVLRDYLMYNGTYYQLLRDNTVEINSNDRDHVKAYYAIVSSIDKSYRWPIERTNAYTLFREILGENRQVVRKLCKCILNEAEGYLKNREHSVSDHMKIMRGYIDQLLSLGHPLTHEKCIALVLDSLDHYYDNFKSHYLTIDLHKSLDELEEMLNIVEMSLPTVALKKGHFYPQSKCTFCKSDDHWRVTCVHYEAWLLDNYTGWSKSMKGRNGCQGKRKITRH